MKKLITIAAVLLSACASGGTYKHADLADRHSSLCRNTAVYQCEVVKP